MLLFLVLTALVANRPVYPTAVVLAGEPLWLNAQRAPLFTPKQLEQTSAATRRGFAAWAATAEGNRLLRCFDRREFRIDVREDDVEASPGRAPQPPLSTLVSARDHAAMKSYELILNPSFGAKGFTPVAGHPSTPADIMATAWAAEMLHIYFYSRGFSLPHHQRAEFQQRWRAVATELGFATLPHRDDAGVALGAQVIQWQ